MLLSCLPLSRLSRLDLSAEAVIVVLINPCCHLLWKAQRKAGMVKEAELERNITIPTWWLDTAEERRCLCKFTLDSVKESAVIKFR